MAIVHVRRHALHGLPVVGRTDRQAGIGEQLAEAATKRPERWIWIHHAPPAKSPTSWGGDRYFGDVELREWIEQYRPDMVLSGHVHQSPFVKEGSWVDRIGPTWVFNAGQQFGAPPAHIVIDTEDRGGAMVLLRGQSVSCASTEPLERPVPKLGSASPLAQSRGSASASGPDVNSSLCWWISVSSTSPTMPRWLPCPSNCRFRSTR